MEVYVSRASWLARLDPRTKVAFAIVGTALLLLTRDLAPVLAWLAVTHVILLSAAVPRSRLGWAWRGLLPLTIMVFVLWPLFSAPGATTLIAVGPLRLTAESLVRGATVALRLDALAFVWFVLLFSTDQTGLVAGLVRLGLPYSWGLTLAIALRYLPSMQDTYAAIYQAQQARGLVVRGRLLAAARAQVPVLVALLISALRTTDQLALALQARGYAPGVRRASRLDLRLNGRDYVALGALVAVTLGQLVWLSPIG